MNPRPKTVEEIIAEYDELILTRDDGEQEYVLKPSVMREWLRTTLTTYGEQIRAEEAYIWFDKWCACYIACIDRSESFGSFATNRLQECGPHDTDTQEFMLYLPNVK